MFAKLWSLWLNQLRHNRRASMMPVSHSSRARRALRGSRTSSRLTLECLESRELLSSYLIADLGTLGGSASQANAINAQGDVVGAAQLAGGTTHAVLWAKGQAAQDLGTLGGANSSASAINILGEIVGSADTSSATNLPFDLQPNKSMTNVNSLLPSSVALNDSILTANGVSDTGVIVGKGSFNLIDLTETAPYSFDPPSGTLNQLDASGAIGQATAVSATMAVANLTNFSTGKTHAVVENIGKPGSSVALPAIPNQVASDVLGLSAPTNVGTQLAVGQATDSSNVTHIVLWTIPRDSFSSATVSDLSSLTTSFSGGAANAVNAEGDVVGTAVDQGTSQADAFVALGSQSPVSLNSLLPPGSGITLTTATGINDSGQICANGTINGQAHAFLLTPVVAAPPQASLTSAPDLNTAGAATYTFVVTYTDANGIDSSTLPGAIQVSGPAGFLQTATLVSTAGPSTQLAATYSITPPGGGTWNFNDDGTYDITLNNNAVKNITGQPIAGGPLGPFFVEIGVVRASVSGTVFNDVNANGKRDAGEGGVPNTDVFIDLNGDGRFDSGDLVTTTDNNGAYAFNGLLPGTCNIMEAVVAPHAVTSPANDVRTVTLSAGQNLTGQDFGDVTDPQILSIVGQRLSDASGSTPQFDQPGTLIHIIGQNFAPGCVFFFGNDQSATQPINLVASTGLENFGIRVSKFATTGPLVVVSPNGRSTVLLPNFTVNSYRNVNGYSFTNDGKGYSDYSIDDLKAVYGADQVDVSADPCGILTLGLASCTVDSGITNPLVSAELSFINSVWLPSAEGQCLGFDLSAARLSLGLQASYSAGQVQIGQFPQTTFGTPATVWDMADPNAGPSPDLRQVIHLAHLEQTSNEFLGHIVGQVATDEAFGVSALINGVKSQLARGLPVLIGFLEQGLSGHCVLCYNVEDGPNGSETLDIYDPDLPFLASEDNPGASSAIVQGAVNGTQHAQRVQGSTITFDSSGNWSYNGGAGHASGGLGSIVATPLGIFNSHTLSASSLTSLLTFGVFGSAAETQVTDAAGHTLLGADGSPNLNPNTKIPNAARYDAEQGAPPLDLIKGTGSFMQTITGTGSGTYTAASLGNDAMATISGVATANGQTDQFGLDSANDKLTFIPAANKAMTADLVINAPAGVQREAQFTATAVGGAAQTLQFQGSQRDHVVFNAVSAGTFSLNLTSNADGLVQTFTTGRMTVAAGDSVDIVPSNWADIQTATATVVVHHANGSTTTSTIANGGAGLQVSAKEAVPFTASVASFTNQTALGKSAVINWGDGTTSTGTVAASGANVTVTGAHTYAKEGYFPTRIILSDANGPLAQATGEASVAFNHFTLAPAKIAAFAGVPFTGTVATLTDIPSGEVASDFAVKINWGDGTTSAGTLQTTSAGQFLVQGAHTWVATGTNSVTVTVTENGAASGQGRTLNVASNTVFSGTVAQLQLPIPGSAPTDYVATIAWGDGTTSTGTLTLQNDGTAILSGSHVYATSTRTHVTHFTLTGGPSASTTSTAVVGAAVGTVTGSIFDDINGNGTLDAGEKGIPDQTVFIDEKNDGKLDAGDPFAVTNSAGVYTIANVPAGPIHVIHSVPNGLRVDAPAPGSYNVTLHAGQTLANLNFADTQLALISGTVFVDSNGNGKRDPSEPGRANQIVFLDLSNNGVLGPSDPTVITDATGAFAFTVNPGSYVVRLQEFTNFTITTPAGGAYHVTVGDGAVNSGGLFGEQPLHGATVPVTVVDAGGVYTGKPFAATATAVGSDGKAVAGSFRFTYFAGSSAGGTPLSGVPIDVGTYTVVATFTSTSNNPASSGIGQTTFTISPAPIAFTIGNDTQAFGWPANLAADLPRTFHTGVNGETLGITYSSSGDTSTAKPGTYAITGVVARGTGKVSNYAVKLTDGTLTVLGPGATLVGTTLFLVGGATSNDIVQVHPTGSSTTGSTGVRIRTTLNNVPAAAVFSQPITAMHIFLYGGNDNVQLAPTLTVNATVNAGNGNDTFLLGNGNYLLTTGDGSNDIVLGRGNNTVNGGNGADMILAGNGTNVINLGDGNDRVLLGNGANTVTLRNGNDTVFVGDGNNVVVTDNGTNDILAGDGDNLIVAGLGQHSVQAGDGNNILIDGSVQLPQRGDTLRKVLNDWALHGDTAANLANIRARLDVTDNSTFANTLRAGNGLDWFWETFAGDITNQKPTDVLN